MGNKGQGDCCGPARPQALDEPAMVAPDASRADRVIAEAPEPQSASTTGMIRLEGGKFLWGNEDEEAWKEDGEGPVVEAELDPFYLDETAVTNAQFAEFVHATGYQTDSERFGWSFVFKHQLPKSRQRKLKGERTVAGLGWWYAVDGASWKKPEGPGSNLVKRMDHPVVHVSWNDAVAYCRWAGKRLPTEAEWEYGARAGLVQKKYPWGDELKPNGRHLCNIWQGKFPEVNTGEDGFKWTCPVKSFPPNGFGFFEVSGNVWEWTTDWHSPTWRINGTRRNPDGPLTGTEKVQKGGSFLCHNSYCNRYRVGARSKNTPDTGTTNSGFRCARDA
jgi:formylglycine-generating enzyme required for sulfatase activity